VTARNHWKFEVALTSAENARLGWGDDPKRERAAVEKTALSDNSAEFEALDRELRTKLERVAWVIVKDWSLAADAVQAAYLTLHQKWCDVLPENRPGWLVKTVQYSAHNIRRAQGSQDKLAVLQFNRPLADTGTSANITENLEKLQTAINTLPDDQRKIVQLRLVEEWTFQQIADHLAIPLGTALSRMRLAIEKLRSVVNENDSE
jgi:RNA polymerase sigma factor (sigma-70 family)